MVVNKGEDILVLQVTNNTTSETGFYALALENGAHAWTSTETSENLTINVVMQGESKQDFYLPNVYSNDPFIDDNGNVYTAVNVEPRHFDVIYNHLVSNISSMSKEELHYYLFVQNVDILISHIGGRDDSREKRNNQ